MITPEDFNELKSKSLQKKKENKKFFQQLKKKKSGEVASMFKEAHEEVFACTDCLKCANCCKTTGPLFTQKDIERISKALKLKPGDFVAQYLRIDEDGDYVLQTLPCPFLGAHNYCSIYDVRPKACREYPHTDSPKVQQFLHLALKNTSICPAVFEIVEKLKEY